MSGCVLVGGGTGFVGKHLIRHLKTKGLETLTVSRNSGVNTITWDDISKNGLPSGINSVVNVAGENVLDFTKRWNDGFKKNVYKSRVDTTSLLSKAINKSSVIPKVFVAISGVGIYPPSESAKYDENSDVKGYDFLSNMCHDWEKAANVDDNKPCRVVSIRSGVVLGRDGGMIKNLYIPFSLGLGGPIGSGKQYLPWIHINDLSSLILFCIENNVTGVLNGVAPENITNQQFSQAFAKSLSRPAIFPAPEFVFNIVYGKERAIMITQGQRVIPKRTSEVGFKFQYPDIQSACDAIVRKN